MAQTCLDTFPPFHPQETSCSLREQQIFYDLMHNLYRLACDEPCLFVNELHMDDVYTVRFNKSSEGKPDLMKNMRLFIKAVDDLLSIMFQMGANKETAKVSKRNREILARLGIREPGPLPPAWVWMCTREKADTLSFSKCLFDPNYAYTRDIFPRLLGDRIAFQNLENWMNERGYELFEYLDGGISMDYANPAWDKDPPRGGFQFKVRHTGIAVNYDRWVKDPAVLGLCIPNGMKDYLAAFLDMTEQLQSFVTGQSKQCDACDYCIQTDKTGRRPRAFVPVTYKAKKYNICPLFPGYSYCWTALDVDVVDNIIEMLSFMDGFLERRR